MSELSLEPLGVLGAGWVGLVTAACFAELGHDVYVRDVDPARIEALQEGRIPIHEPGLGELVARHRERLHFTLAAEDVFERASIVFICVGTPPMYSGDADLSAVWSVIDELPATQGRIVLVMKSTVPVGTGEAIRGALTARGLAQIGYVSNPEFLAEGSALQDFSRPDRIVIGAFDPADGDRVEALYAQIDAPIVHADVPSAEMVKLASNAMLATRVSFINEIANVCEVTGADVETVAKGMGLDRRIGSHFLRAGIGYSGNCLPKDVAALKQLAGNTGYHFQLLAAVIEVNELQKRRVIAKLVKHLGALRGKTITLLGLAFKPNTNDMRQASSLVLAARLLSEGARVRGWDPVAVDVARELLPGVELFDDMLEALSGADAAVIVTEWDEVRNLPYDAVGRVMRTASPGRRKEHPRSGRGSRSDVRLRRHGPALVRLMEAIVLAGGKAERLGDAAQGRPKALVHVGGSPLVGYQIALLRAAGVERVIISCAAGQGQRFGTELAVSASRSSPSRSPSHWGVEADCATPLPPSMEAPPVFALNGDELLDIDLPGLLAQHTASGAGATITVSPLTSAFGVVDLDDGLVTGFREAPQLPYWVNCGFYVLGEEAIARLPARGDHERTTFPELAARGTAGALFATRASG